MPPSPQILEDLREAYATGELIVFAGDGIPRAAGIFSWYDLAQQLVDRLRDEGAAPAVLAEVEELIRPMRLVEALSAIEHHLGAREFALALEKALDDGQRPVPDVARAIAALEPLLRAVLTTNLDCFLERAFEGRWQALTAPVGDIAQRRRYIIKLHGSLIDRTTWAFARDRYDQATFGWPRHRRTFEALFQTCPILFVGASFADDALEPTFAAVRALSGPQPPTHFAMLERNIPPFRRKSLVAAGLRLLEYDSFDDVPGLLRSLLPSPLDRRDHGAHRAHASVLARPREGTCARVSVSRLPVTRQQLVGRDAELSALDESWTDPAARVISIVASGGVGKTALVNTWLRRLERTEYEGVDRVFAWSFYSQTHSDQHASADAFIEAALRWFGDADPTKGSAWDRGVRLADLVRSYRTLLILDGIELLQTPSGPREGMLTDRALRSLLLELAAQNCGLCVITSRLPVADLAMFEERSARWINLTRLSPETGAELLAAIGAKGASADLADASVEYEGHSLSLLLLGTLLRDAYDGDIGRRGEIRALGSEDRSDTHVGQLLGSYERRLGDGPELRILLMLGLFDRPAEGPAIAALRRADAIAGLTDTLRDLDDARWAAALSTLRRAHLLAEAAPDDAETLDTHPLIRGHFRELLQRTKPEAWKSAHAVLFDHFKSATAEHPRSAIEMAQLYLAVAHGCAAGKTEEAYKAYEERIRYDEAGEEYNWQNLGIAGAELDVIAYFFEQRWSRPFPGCSDPNIQHYVGILLQATGNFDGAIELYRASLERSTANRSHGQMLGETADLSMAYLVRGDVQQAIDYATQCASIMDAHPAPGRMLFSNESTGYKRAYCRARLASALHQANRMKEAETAFDRAQAELDSYHSFCPMPFLCKGTRLSGIDGYDYVNFLLDVGDISHALAHASRTLMERDFCNLLEEALSHLAIGKSHVARAMHESSNGLGEATDHMNKAVDLLQELHVPQFVAEGFLARARLHCYASDLPSARNDAEEALAIAERDGMRLHEADARLVWVRIHAAAGDRANAREALEAAREKITATGYRRRDAELVELEVLLGLRESPPPRTDAEDQVLALASPASEATFAGARVVKAATGSGAPGRGFLVRSVFRVAASIAKALSSRR